MITKNLILEASSESSSTSHSISIQSESDDSRSVKTGAVARELTFKLQKTE